MLFAHKHVDMNAISCNKLILLHGPPGKDVHFPINNIIYRIIYVFTL